MEDVLAVYQRTYAEDEILVCMDETSKQHIKETRIPLPARPGEPEKYDFEYERNGVSNLFIPTRGTCAFSTSGRMASCQSDRPPY
jgi:hypothetical protein